MHSEAIQVCLYYDPIPMESVSDCYLFEMVDLAEQNHQIFSKNFRPWLLPLANHSSEPIQLLQCVKLMVTTLPIAT